MGETPVPPGRQRKRRPAPRVPFIVALVALSTFSAGCNAGASSATPPSATPAPGGATPTPTPAPTATPIPAPAIPTSSPYAVTQSTVVAPPSPAAGQTAAPVAIALAAGGGVTGVVQLPAANATIPPNTAVVYTVTNTMPAALPALSLGRVPRGVARTPLAAGSVATIQIDKLQFSNQVTLAAQPSFTYTVPAAYGGLANVSYWLAHYDPLYALAGWDHGFEGPGNVSGTTIAFTGSPGTFVFLANQPQYFALYAVAAAASSPTPAPFVSPAPTPPPLTASAASVSLLGLGQTATVTLTDASTTYAGGYTATSLDPTIATASSSGKTITVTAVAPGRTIVTVSATDGRSVIIIVDVTSTTVPVQ